MDRTLVLLKPDTLQRGLVGEILSRLERRGLKIVAMKLMQMDEDLANRHYDAHVDKPFFRGLVEFITLSPLVAIVFEADNVVDIIRTTMGDTNAAKAAPGTIRGDFGIDIGRNLIHGSDSIESAEREIALFFNKEDLVSYKRDTDGWITEP